MKFSRRTIEEVTVIGPNSKKEKVLDELTNKRYTVLRLGPHIKADGWSWDVKRFEIVASRPVSQWKPTTKV